MKKFVFPLTSVLLSAVLLLAYCYKESLGYNFYIEKGNILLAEKNYDKALNSYKKAVSYQYDPNINKKIKNITQLQEDTLKYNTAVSLMDNKEYDKALNIFRTIENFQDSKNMIKECLAVTTEEKLNEAEICISSHNFEKALSILKSDYSDKENEEVKRLIAACSNNINSELLADKRKDLLKSIKGVYKLLVEIKTQHVYVYKYNKLIKTMVCSTGMSGFDTPVGKFKITDRGDFFYSDKYEEGAYYWVRFNETYLFHSIPYDKDRNIIQGEADKLGEMASHGCVRLSLEDAKWVYDNIPRNISRVLIY